MFPGDTVFCPEGFRQFWIFNADWMEGASFAIDVQARPVGYCGFLVGTSPDGSAPTQAAVEPAARVVHVSNLITLAPFFSPGRATRFNLKISALNGGAVTGVPFTLQIEHRGFFRDSAVVAGFERETLDFPTQSSYAALTRAWITAGATPAYPTSRSFDLPPAMIHAFVYISHRAWSGAITDFQCVIEAED